MASIVFIAEAHAMIGHKVKAVGCCGITDGVTIVGILERLENGDAIVLIDHGTRRNILPCLVNKNTLELANGKCGKSLQSTTQLNLTYRPGFIR